jgi:hypothetical protein
MGAFADGTSQGFGEGGPLAKYAPIVAEFNASGERFRIEGVCQSACTMFLGIRNVCVERDATLKFHAGHDIKADVTGPDTLASRRMLATYSDKLRSYLISGHHMDTGEFFSLSGAELIDRFGYPECPRN